MPDVCVCNVGDSGYVHPTTNKPFFRTTVDWNLEQIMSRRKWMVTRWDQDFYGPFSHRLSR